MISVSIPVHSLIDNITNSSTVTYIYARDNAVEVATGMLEKLMATFGIVGKVEDYFDITFGPDEDWLEEQREYADDDDDQTTEELEEQLASGRDSNGYSHMMINIVSKKDPGLNLTNAFLSMFDAESEYDG